MKQIIIKISPKGMIQAETVNMQGHECQKYIKSIEELTNAVSVDSSYKPEFYMGVEEKNSTDNMNDIQEPVKNTF